MASHKAGQWEQHGRDSSLAWEGMRGSCATMNVKQKPGQFLKSASQAGNVADDRATSVTHSPRGFT
jgi:hypothetical protein